MANDTNPLEDLKVASDDRAESEVTQEDQTIDGIVLDPLAGPAGGDEGMRLSKFWQDQIKAVDETQNKWVKRCEKIIKRYRDERYGNYDRDDSRRFNSLWCNVEILLPALYGREPQPIVERRFRDKDPTGRTAATILERALRNNLEISGFNAAVDQAVKDYLLPGRGICWVRYEPEFGPSISLPVENQVDIADSQGDIEPDEEEIEDDSSEEKLRDTGDRIIRESVPVDYVSWSDFYIFPPRARIWKEVTAVGKRCYLTRDQMKERFGEEIGKAVPLAQRDKNKERSPGSETSQFYNDDDARRGEIFEIWSRQDETVYWVAEGYSYLLDRKDDPLELENFYPVPMPLQANVTSDSIIPVPDYIQYQDQAVQIDELTMRISKLTQACKVVGLYNGAAKNIQRILQEGVENELIAVDQWAAFAEKGGVAGQISLLPLKEIIGVINELTGVRQRVMADMDRLTGITDIMRGTTDARETMGAQRLKTNGSSTRLQRRQDYVARFARDIIRLQADVMSKHFSPQTFVEMSGAMYDEGMGGDKTPIPVSPAAPGLSEMFPDMVMPLSAVQGAPSPFGQGAGMPPGGMPTSPPVAASPPGAVPGSPQQIVGMQPPPPMPGGNPMLNGNSPPPSPGGLGGVSGPVPSLPPPQQMNGAGPPPGPQMPGTAVASPQMPGLPAPMPEPQMIVVPRGLVRIAAAIDLLRNEKLRGFRIDIETDSTIYGDMQQEKTDRVEFLKAVGPFMQQAVQLGATMPQAAPMLGKFVQFVTRGFRVGRDLENSIEDFCEQAEKMAQDKAASPQATPPSPEMIKGQIEQQKSASALQQTQIETQGEQHRQQLENEGDLQEAQVNADAKRIEAQAEMRRIDLEEKQLALEMKREEFKMRELELKYGMHKNELKSEHAQRTHEAGLAEFDAQNSEAEHQRDLEAADMEHGQNLELNAMDHAHDRQKAKDQTEQKAKLAAQRPKNPIAKPPSQIQ